MPEPFLRIPPFPGHRAPPLARPGGDEVERFDPHTAIAALRRHLVGGTFWAAETLLPAGRDVLLVPANAAQLVQMLGALEPGERGRAVVLAPAGLALPDGIARIVPPCDPWSLVEHAARCLCDADSDLALVAALAGRTLHLFGAGRFAGADADLAGAVSAALARQDWRDPFDGQAISAIAAIELLGIWRDLIWSNRDLAAIYGVAGWKRVTADAMLWDGTGPVRHARALPPGTTPRGRVLAWKSRTPAVLLERLRIAGCAVAELEDGFIRSVGLGANCVPPLSVIVDRAGVYFDPNGSSDLEHLLENSTIDAALCARAAALRQQLVQAAISKYGQEGDQVIQRQGNARRVLVTGQVEDDRSVLSGGAGTSNLELLARARALESDAWIIYKPHPDVEAGHRKGHVPEAEALRYADEVQRDTPIIPLIDSVDALHVITSLAGFEAMLRGKSVTCHGVPFYAGWGLTRDLAAVPPRRTRPRSLDELVAATLLLYPRYLDPVTRLPCSAEVVVRRMAAGQARVTSPLIMLREWQGRARLGWRKLTGGK